jgi:hypothetical protein
MKSFKNAISKTLTDATLRAPHWQKGFSIMSFVQLNPTIRSALRSGEPCPGGVGPLGCSWGDFGSTVGAVYDRAIVGLSNRARSYRPRLQVVEACFRPALCASRRRRTRPPSLAE